LVTAPLPNPKIRHWLGAAVAAPDLERYMGMFVHRKLAALCSILLAEFVTLSAFAIEVTDPTAAAHAYPGLCDVNGKKLADGEFRQWVENNRHCVVVSLL
jgi:hypothetical protein